MAISVGRPVGWVGQGAWEGIVKPGAWAGKAAGRTAGRAGRATGRGIVRGAKKSSPAAAVALIGGAAAYGAASAFTDSEGPWGDVQESLYGDRDTYGAFMRAGISSVITPSQDVIGRGDYYYGQAVSPSSDRTQPVSGGVVIGMYNRRR